MSRDDGLVGLVKGLQGAQATQETRRPLRAGDYAGAAAVVVRGYGWLQNLEKEASGAVVLQQLHDNLSKLSGASHAEFCAQSMPRTSPSCSRASSRSAARRRGRRPRRAGRGGARAKRRKRSW